MPAASSTAQGSDSHSERSIRIIQGDALSILRTLPDESVHCVVTSPPYWGLRDYGVPGQMGLEPTLGEHIAAMVAVFREVRRVLRKDGTCWVNYGDCYATAPNGRSAADTKAAGNDDRTFRDKPFSTVDEEMKLKTKDLCMIPNRIAIALQDDGWFVRSEIIWAKPNPMPESVRDRPTSAHEKIWLLTKSGESTLWRYRGTDQWVTRQPAPDYRWVHRETGEETAAPQNGPEWRRINLWRAFDYFYDAEAVRSEAKSSGRYVVPDGWATGPGVHHPVAHSRRKDKSDKQRGHGRRHAGFNDRWNEQQARKSENTPRNDGTRWNENDGRGFITNSGANLRNVWTIPTKGYPDAHFATFPPEIPERCIKAGCPKGGVVLDPFAGAGTVGLVADRLQRHAILIELNPEYCEMTRERLEADHGMFGHVLMEPANA